MAGDGRRRFRAAAVAASCRRKGSRVSVGRRHRESGGRVLGGLMLLAAVIALAGALVARSSSTVLAAKSVTWASYDITLDLQQDGTYHVTERQTIDFSGGTFTGAFAQLPLERTEGIDNIAVGEVGADGTLQQYA